MFLTIQTIEDSRKTNNCKPKIMNCKNGLVKHSMSFTFLQRENCTNF